MVSYVHEWKPPLQQFPPLASLPAQEKRISTRLTLALFVLLVGLAIHIDLAFSSNDITVIA